MLILWKNLVNVWFNYRKVIKSIFGFCYFFKVLFVLLKLILNMDLIHYAAYFQRHKHTFSIKCFLTFRTDLSCYLYMKKYKRNLLKQNLIFAGSARVYSFGFGYGAVWGSIILLFASVVLLICDRESEEIFYKEKQVEEEEEEDAGEA